MRETKTVSKNTNKKENESTSFMVILIVDAIIAIIVAVLAVGKMIYMQTEINFLKSSLSEAMLTISTMCPNETENSIDMMVQLDELF